MKGQNILDTVVVLLSVAVGGVIIAGVIGGAAL